MTVLIDCKLWLDGYDLSGDMNALRLDATRDAVEATTFGNTSRVYRPGLRKASFGHTGYFQSDGASAVDDILRTFHNATSPKIMTIAPPDGTAGGIAYSFQAVSATHGPFGGQIGDMAKLEIAGEATGDAVRATILEDGVTSRSASGQSTGYQLGDIAAGEQGYAALHVIGVTGSPTLDVEIESDTSNTFPAPTSRGSFTQATGLGAQWLPIGPTITDTWWRTKWTFGGTGSVLFVVTFGIN